MMWTGLNRALIWLIGRFFIFLVKTTVLPKGLNQAALVSTDAFSANSNSQFDTNDTEVDINPDINTQIKPTVGVLYAIQDDSLADLTVLQQTCKSLQLPSPTQRLSLGNKDELRSFFSLKRWDGINPKRKQGHRHYQQPELLERTIQALQTDSAMEVKVVPVSIYWGRSPDKERSIWKMIFSDNWGAPNALRKFFMVLLHGRDAFVKFNDPISLRQVIDEAQEAQSSYTPEQQQVKATLTTRKIARVLRVHFRRQREAIVGPDLSHRRTLISSLLRTKAVREAIVHDAKTENISIEKAEKKARAYANEIAADYSHPVIQIYRVVLAWLWNRLYDGVSVHNSDQLALLAQNYEIVYTPCHRSHIDYLLLSYVLYMEALVPPHVAAGVNLNLPVLGPILRRGGAFFMRRSFDNKLYSTLFSEYLNTVLSKGFAIEYFIEGGRSRTGRMLQPRTGMIAMTVRSYLQNKQRPIAFVPVYIGYEKVFEGASYQGELKGKTKKKESLLDLLKSARQIKRNFGKVSANFGEPIFLDQHLDEANAQWASESYKPEDRPPWIKDLVSNIGMQIVTHLNAAAVINPVNLAGLVLLSTPKHALDERTLKKQLSLYLTIQAQVRYSDSVVNEKLSANEIIKDVESKNLIMRQQHALGDLIYLTEENAVNLTFFRNNIVHLFALPGLIASCVINDETISIERIIHFCRLIYPFVKSELFLPWEGKSIDQTIRKIVSTLVNENILTREQGSRMVSIPDSSSEQYVQLKILASAMNHTLERYYITAAVLLNNGKGNLGEAELENLCHLMAQRLSVLHEFNAPEFFDKTVFKNFIQNLQKAKLIWKDDNNTLHYGDLIEEFTKESWRLLGRDIQLSIRQVTDSKTKLLSPTSGTE